MSSEEVKRSVKEVDETEDKKTVSSSVKPQEASLSKDELLKALDEDFATSVSKIYVNSLGQEVGFKEISVKDQKTMSRIMIANEQRQDVIYDAQCGIINKTALLDGFDIYQLTEFDRLKLLIALYQNNMFANDVKFTCPHCKAENQYRLDFGSTLRKLDQIDTAPQEFEYENKSFKYKFVAAYPKVKLVSEFYRGKYAKGPGGVAGKQMPAPQQRMPNGRPQPPQASSKVEAQLVNMEYIDLFLKSVEITSKQKGTSRTIDLESYAEKYGAPAVEEILSKFTQDVLYSENGALSYVAKNFLQKMNDSFDRHQCQSCGEYYEGENSDQAESFL